ncbi:MAG TPA: hypothetical protein VFZ73_17665, partial [Gemmatimonadaceae bacterium]
MASDAQTRSFVRYAGALLGMLLACGGGGNGPLDPPAGGEPVRSWRMGFSAIPPRPDQQVLLDNLA